LWQLLAGGVLADAARLIFYQEGILLRRVRSTEQHWRCTGREANPAA